MRWRIAYCSAVETDVKVLLRFLPSPCTVAMIATEIPAAIKPYSIAVAPCSLRRNFKIKVRMTVFLSVYVIPCKQSPSRAHAMNARGIHT